MKLFSGLMVLLLLLGCLPWQSPSGNSDPSAALPPEVKAKDHSSAPSSQTRQQPFQPSRIPSSGSSIEVTATITHPATILGKPGFSPAELAIEAGDSVTWTNHDPQKKVLVLTFQKAGTREFITSRAIRPGREWDHVFTEPGEYIYWTVGYGVKGKVMVREEQ